MATRKQPEKPSAPTRRPTMPETNPEQDAAIVGVEKCGCVTLACARPGDQLDPGVVNAIVGILLGGGKVLTTTVGEARAMPNFMVDCEHDSRQYHDNPPFVDERMVAMFVRCPYCGVGDAPDSASPCFTDDGEEYTDLHPERLERARMEMKRLGMEPWEPHG